MKKESVNIQTLSSQERILKFVESVNPVTMLFVSIIIFFTSDHKWLTLIFCALPPLVGTLGFRVAMRYKFSYFPLFMTFFAAIDIFCVCFFAGASSPTFLAGYTNTVFAVFNIKNVRYRFLAILLCFAVITCGCLLAGMNKFYLLSGLFSLAAYVFVLWKALNFLLVLGNEVTLAKEEIQEKAMELAVRHKEITDSINYAERIQRSFLATKELLDENLKEYFVLFKPKDIVSGDFYWAGKLSNGNFALATADSTGHGVPGAIMSILNISSLEQTVNTGLYHSSDILNQTRERIIERLKKDGSAEGGKDGMDASLICFDLTNNKLGYSAANNPVLIVRENTLVELAPDKMPVGKHDKDTIPFTQNEFQLQKGDMIYTLTDGLPDQFGGPKGKKFMYKKLKELLISLATEPMATQKQELNKAFEDWKGGLEQIDDVCLIGIRV